MSIFTRISNWWKNRGKNEDEPEVYLGVTPEEHNTKKEENIFTSLSKASCKNRARVRPQRIVVNNTNYRNTYVNNDDSSLTDAVLAYAILSNNNTDDSGSDYSGSTYSSDDSSSRYDSCSSSSDSSSWYSSSDSSCDSGGCCDCSGGGD